MGWVEGGGWSCCAGRARRKKQKQKPRGKTGLEGNGTHGVDHTLDEQFHGYRVKGSLPWLAREFGDVSFFFSLFFFRILPVTVISLLFLTWSISFFFFLFCSFSIFWSSWWKVVQGAWKGYMQYFRGIFETRFALRTRVWSAD